MKTPAERVLAVRLAHGWDQREMAEALGVNQSFVCHMERGRHEPGPTTLERLEELEDQLRQGA